MSTIAVHDVIKSLRSLGLNLELTSERALKVAPASILTPELRDIIRSHRDDLIDWLAAATGPLAGLDGWEAQSDVYERHHFKCNWCIAAGMGYGLRCGVGMALWRAYCAAPNESPARSGGIARSPLEAPSRKAT